MKAATKLKDEQERAPEWSGLPQPKARHVSRVVGYTRCDLIMRDWWLHTADFHCPGSSSPATRTDLSVYAVLTLLLQRTYFVDRFLSAGGHGGEQQQRRRTNGFAN